MRDEYQRHAAEHPDVAPHKVELWAADSYLHRELSEQRPSSEAGQWAMLETLLAERHDTAGDAIVIVGLIDRYLRERRERYGERSAAAFLQRVKDAVSGVESYRAFVRERDIPGVVVGTDTPCWADYCAWLVYALAGFRAS
jgi:hypothetical protein